MPRPQPMLMPTIPARVWVTEEVDGFSTIHWECEKLGFSGAITLPAAHSLIKSGKTLPCTGIKYTGMDLLFIFK